MSTERLDIERISDVLAARCPLFRGLGRDEVAALLQRADCAVKSFQTGDVFATEGSPCLHADIVIGGGLKAGMMGPSFKQAQISSLSAGNVVAPAFIFATVNAFPVSVEVTEPTQILRMSPQAFLQLLAADSRVNMNFIRLLSDTNSFLSHKVRVLALYSVREKVAHFLLSEAKKQGGTTLHLKQSRQEIADRLGIQKFSLIRTLNEFQDSGAIHAEGKDITIMNAGLLR